MIRLEISKNSDSKWDKNLKNSKFGTIFQSKEYGSYLKSRLKAEPKFIKFVDSKDNVVGQILISQMYSGARKINKFFGRGFVYSSVAKFDKVLPKYTFWKFGPVIMNNSYINEISRLFGIYLIKQKGKINGVTHPLNSNFYLPDKFKKIKTSTFIINLQEDLEKILSNTDKHSVQKNIIRSQKRGVTISPIKSDNDIKIYSDLQTQFRKKNENITYSLMDKKKYFELLKPLGCHGYLAWYHEKPIGGISFTSFNGFINELGIARSEVDSRNNLYSQDLLRWKIIEWGVKNNAKYYDLSGVKTNDRSSKEDGIFRNKKKWGGKLYHYWTFMS